MREVEPEILGRSVVRASLSNSVLLIDLRLSGGRQLLASLDRTTPALYLSTEVATQSFSGKHSSTAFVSLLRKHLIGSRIVKVWKEPLDRIVQFDFEKLDAGDNKVCNSLLLGFTGRSANAYLTAEDGDVVGSLFEYEPSEKLPQFQSLGSCDFTSFKSEINDTASQSEVLERYFGNGSIFGPQLRHEFLYRCSDATPTSAFNSLLRDLFECPPQPLVYSRLPLDRVGQVVLNPKADLLLSHIELAQARDMIAQRFSSLSEAADQYYSARGRALSIRAEHATLKQTLVREVNKRESALKAIESDRARFDQPDKLKRIGDLILANLTNARIEGPSATVVDYYDPDQPEIRIAIPDGLSLKEAASDYFARYQKARRALTAIASREREVLHNLEPLRQLLSTLEQIPTAENIDDAGKETRRLLGNKQAAGPLAEQRIRGKGGYAFGRRFRSTDGYEIVVGRNDRDNDALTFRLAKPNDIWLHAADYPGSHAIIRNPARDAPPHRAITEAAEVAAFYSQAKGEGKAAVHYTQKKFVSKPPRSKPGLVRLSSFKTIVVEPRCNLERLG